MIQFYSFTILEFNASDDIGWNSPVFNRLGFDRSLQRNGISDLVEPLSGRGLGFILCDVPDPALADQLVVTAESASMLAEASATGKPLFMFDFSGNQCDRASAGNYPVTQYLHGPNISSLARVRQLFHE